MSPSKDNDAALLGGDDQADRLAPGVWKVVCVAAIGSFMALLDATVVNVSLASLATDLNVSLLTIQWVTSGYLLALALMLPLSGWLVDRIGARALYLWCFAAFTLSSTLCGLAASQFGEVKDTNCTDSKDASNDMFQITLIRKYQS